MGIKLDKKLMQRIDWRTFRTNPNEQKGDNTESFDAIVNSMSGNEKFIVEITNIYNYKNQKAITEVERTRKEDGSVNVEIAREHISLDEDVIIKSIISSVKKKNSKAYMFREEKKILILEAKGIHFNLIFLTRINSNPEKMKEHPLITLLRKIKLSIGREVPDNKFDEILIRTYPNQPKEEVFSLSNFNIYRDSHLEVDNFRIKYNQAPNFKNIPPWFKKEEKI